MPVENREVRREEQGEGTFFSKKKGREFGCGNTVCKEDYDGTRKTINKLQVKFDCREGSEGVQFSEFLRVTTAYLSKKLEGSGDVETLIRNGKVFELAWPNPVRTTPEATEAMLRADYGTRAKRVEKLWINLSTAYGLVLDQ